MPPVKKTDVAPRSAFPLTLTASTWSDVLSAAHKRAADKNGTWPTGAPRLTNGDAVQLVRAWTSARSRAAFPLWYQFAAVAYGWNPDTDALDTGASQARGWYAGDATPELWASLALLAASADDDNTSSTPALYFNDAWSDVTFAADVRNALRGDGASAAFKIPLPACKDPKTGKPVGKPHKDPKTGKWRCDPVTVDDPITHASKHVALIAVVIGLLWLASKDSKPRRRRRT